MGEPDTITITRHQLYEQAWSVPMTQLAKSFHLSDVGLAKVCRKHLIPYPPRGYWAKKRHGKRVRQSQLPPCDDPGLQSILFVKNASRHKCSKVPAPEPAYDSDVMKVLERIRAIEFSQVKTELRNPHPLVQLTNVRLRQATPNEHKLVFPRRDENGDALNVLVAPESVQRAMLYLNALVRTFEKVGGSIEIKKERWRRETRIRILGESPMQIRLRERYRQTEKPKESKTNPWYWRRMDYFPSGLFVLEGNHNCYWHVLCRDTKRSRVEDRILATITDWVKTIGKDRIARRLADEARRIQEEKNRVQREQQLELQRCQAELEHKQMQERDKVESLHREANSWYKSKSLREYIQAVEQHILDRNGKIAEDSEEFRWLQWARQQADRLDPLSPSPPSVLDERIG